MTRREWIRNGSIAALTWSGSVNTAGRGRWATRPMRWIQIAFVEDDPGRYDIGFWVDYMKRLHVDAACLSAGGCVAFYPTKVPPHYRSKWLSDGDAFGELAAACRKLGMNVVARVDPHAAHKEMAEAHPDWMAVDETGKTRAHWAMPEYTVTCGLGPYNFQFMTSVVREIATNYKVDGIFANRWSGSGMCFCRHCAESFRKFSGFELPRADAPADVRNRHIVWRDERLFELWDLWDQTIGKAQPDAVFIPNTGGGALSEIDMDRTGRRAATLFADRQGRSGSTPVWACGKNGKEYRAGLGDKPIAGLFSVGLEAPYRWKDSTQSAAELKIWAAEGIAQGLRPWLIKFNARPTDERWMKPMEEIFDWHYRNDRYMRNTSNLARTGLVFSQQTARFYGGSMARQRVEEAILGAYHALIEARIPFDMVHDRRLDEASVERFDTLVLPNIAALSDAQCAQLKRFAERGGGIVATHETSLYDEWGKQRKDFGLAELFGAHFAGRLIVRQQNAYLRFANTAHPLLAGFEEARRTIHGAARVELRAEVPGVCPLLTIPSYPDLPMEEVYVREGSPEYPAVFSREVGRGRIVYFPFDLDRTFWEVMHPDHGRLLANAVRWVSRGKPVVEVTGPGIIDIAVWRQAHSITVHLVNLTNPMLMRAPFREIIPVGGQEVALRLPEDVEPKGVKLLVNGGVHKWTVVDGVLRVITPSIGLHEVVAVDF